VSYELEVGIGIRLVTNLSAGDNARCRCRVILLLSVLRASTPGGVIVYRRQRIVEVEHISLAQPECRDVSSLYRAPDLHSRHRMPPVIFAGSILFVEGLHQHLPIVSVHKLRDRIESTVEHSFPTLGKTHDVGSQCRR
jgi:hypothetical protein